MADLEESARLGCDFCSLLVQALASRPYQSTLWDGNEFTVEESGPKTVLETARYRGDQSDLLICISTAHVATGSPLSEVEMLDLLLVHVGSINDPALSPASDSSLNTDSILSSLPTIKLLLTAPRGKPVHVNGFRIGRSMLDLNLSSRANFSIARDWVSLCCREHHLTCGPIDDDSPLPTRVVDVGDGTRPDHLKLFVSNDTRAKYLALSHCWGGAIATTLTVGNLKDFSIAIRHEDLPRNFQDAIEITQQLGIRYLWIDSLCIIQDSREDWARESSKMAAVYQNAFITICALSSPGSGHGIFGRHSSDRQDGVELPVSTHSSITVHLLPREEEEDLHILSESAPLNRRSWCLQEAVLSRRVLCYGERQMYWGCRQGLKAADELPGPENVPARGFGPQVLGNSLDVQPGDKVPFQGQRLQDLMSKYYLLVQDSSRRGLTYDSDKLPAFSGIAGRLHTLIGGDYIAGIWMADFHRGILWSAVAGESAKHVEEYRAPSWSWASTNEPVWAKRSLGVANSTPMAQDDNCLQLLEYSVQLKDIQNPYGEVTSGHIIVRGQTAKLLRIHGLEFESVVGVDCPGSVYFDALEMGGERTGTNLFMSNAIGEDASRMFLATSYKPGFKKRRGVVTPGTKEYTVLVVKKIWFGSQVDDYDVKSATRCLVLEELPGLGDDVYQRAGFLETREIPAVDTIPATWEVRTLKIV